MRQFYFYIFFVFIFISRLSAQSVDSLIMQLDALSGESKAKNLNKITWKLRNSDPREALRYSEMAIEYCSQNSYYYELAKAYNFGGVLYRNLGVYSQALENYQIALEISKKHNFEDQLGYTYNNFGNLYLYQELPALAKENLLKVPEIALKQKNNDLLAYAYQNLGRSYLLLNKSDSALFWLKRALKIRIDAKIVDKVGVTYKYLGDAYLYQNEYIKALEYYQKAKLHADFNSDIDLYSDYCSQLSHLYLEINMRDSALFYASMSLVSAREVQSNLRIMKACKELSSAYEAEGDFRKALTYSNLVIAYKDSLYTEQVSKKIASIEFTSQQLKKEAEIALLKKDAEINIINRDRILYVAVFLGLTVIGSLVFFILFNRSRNKIKRFNVELINSNNLVNEQNLALKEQSIEMEIQAQNLQKLNIILEKQNKALEERQVLITDSINYARRIQQGLMPEDSLLNHLFKSYFVVNIPRDIVSGDFYWAKIHGDYTYFAVADSTGHGVSGAFMSVLGISLLNEIVSTSLEDFLDTGTILNELRIKVKESLGQKTISDNKDGLDIAIVKIDKKKKVLEFSGAHNDAFLVSQGALEIIESQRMPVAVSRNERNFETIQKEYSEGDRLYLSTDGFQDQLGGAKGRKYFKKNYRDFLVSIAKYDLSDQKDKIVLELENWREGKYKQIDDILIVGLEL